MLGVRRTYANVQEKHMLTRYSCEQHRPRDVREEHGGRAS